MRVPLPSQGPDPISPDGNPFLKDRFTSHLGDPLSIHSRERGEKFLCFLWACFTFPVPPSGPHIVPKRCTRKWISCLWCKSNLTGYRDLYSFIKKKYSYQKDIKKGLKRQTTNKVSRSRCNGGILGRKG